MSLLVKSEILGLFVIIFTGDHKHSFCNRENLQQSIQMQLPKKEKFLSDFFASFLKSTSKFEHFQKKNNDPHIYPF